MTHKLRYAMSERDETYTLGGKVEIDDAFFGASSRGGKRGRGTDKTAVIVSVSLSNDGKPRYAKMKVVETIDGETVKEFAEQAVASGSEVHTDGLPVYHILGGIL